MDPRYADILKAGFDDRCVLLYGSHHVKNARALAVAGIDHMLFSNTYVQPDASFNLSSFSLVDRNYRSTVGRELDRIDPRRRGVCLGDSTFPAKPKIVGREVWGARTAACDVIEDKMQVDAIFQAAGVDTPRSQIVDVNDRLGALRAYRSVATRGGVVMSLDNTWGRSTGSQCVFGAPSEKGLMSLLELYSELTDRVRIAGYAPGVPMSMGFFVLPNGKVETLLPIENVIQTTGDVIFSYLGVSNIYQPRPRLVAKMEETARRVGAVLHREYGYTGAGSVDGLVSNKFLVTEINPRFSAGFRLLGSSVPTIPIELLNALMISYQRTGLSKDAFDGIGESVRSIARDVPSVDEIRVNVGLRFGKGGPSRYRFDRRGWQPTKADGFGYVTAEVSSDSTLAVQNLHYLGRSDKSVGELVRNLTSQVFRDHGVAERNLLASRSIDF